MSDTPSIKPSETVDGQLSAALASAGSTVQKFRSIPKWMEEAIAKGVKIWLTADGYEVDGFYRNLTMRLVYDDKGGLKAIDKKEKSVPINTFDDLVRLNYDWWKRCRDKKAEWMMPSREWIEEFSRLNLVKRQVTFVPGED